MMRTRRIAAVALGVLVVSAGGGTQALAAPSSPGERVTRALQQVPGLLSESNGTRSQEDAEAAARTDSVIVPHAPTKGVELRNAAGSRLRISLPGARSGRRGERVDPGVVVFPSDGTVSNAVQIRSDGNAVRLLSVITGRSGGSDLRYDFSAPGGARLDVVEGGAVALYDGSHHLLSMIAPAWAKDANNKQIPTWYTAQGGRLTQHLDLSGDVAFPVVADPTVQWNWWGLQIKFTKWETQVIGWGVAAAGAYFGWTGWAAVAAVVAQPLAQWATSNGYCLAMNRAWNGVITPWAYRC